MQSLHWIWPLSGGLMIGLSAALYLLLNGRIAGISGLLASAAGLSPVSSRSMAAHFLAALLLGALVASAWLRTPVIEITSSIPLLIVGGLLVGFGTRLGGGCTSGHGVCGMARLAPRSIVATLLFMTVAILTVLLMRVLGGVWS